MDARCVCAINSDGSTTRFLCPVHADIDPCQTLAQVTGKRRKGTIRRGTCTHCGHVDPTPEVNDPYFNDPFAKPGH